ncbi:MAG TPA: antitoxin Xre-like helix-turn-helix domain-containing protein [Methylomirabilota bacterium]|jgi:putative toxin-antitoxin system antitoxin component (TIGR02293 family)|nr:antitoxin Xre-like helix-turn-helix domain-containing protein [Methylomirabilota bacterium]
MISTARLVQALGGQGVLRKRRATYEAIIDTARTGLPYAALETIATRFEIPQETLVRVLHLPPRTLARRKKARRLSADESDRLLRLARVAARAEEVLGSRERAGAWLRGTVRALGQVRPLDLLDTDLGAQQVERILGRIEHGVYS